MNWKWLVDYLIISHSLQYTVVREIVNNVLLNEKTLLPKLLEYITKCCISTGWNLSHGTIFWHAQRNTESFRFGIVPADSPYISVVFKSDNHVSTIFSVYVEDGLGNCFIKNVFERVAPEQFFVEINKVIL